MGDSAYSYKIPEQGFKAASAGVHQAKIFQVAFLGFQDGGKFKPSRRMALNWLLDEGTTIVQKVNPSSHKLGKYGPLLDAVTNKTNTPAEIDGFDIGSLLGLSATLQIKHKTNPTSGKVLAEVGAVLPAMGTGAASIVPADFAFIYPGIDPAIEAIELPKFPGFIQKNYTERLTEVQYLSKLSAWNAANPKAKEATESSLA